MEIITDEMGRKDNDKVEKRPQLISLTSGSQTLVYITDTWKAY